MVDRGVMAAPHVTAPVMAAAIEGAVPRQEKDAMMKNHDYQEQDLIVWLPAIFL